jgi:hypothetical protein
MDIQTLLVHPEDSNSNDTTGIRNYLPNLMEVSSADIDG